MKTPSRAGAWRVGRLGVVLMELALLASSMSADARPSTDPRAGATPDATPWNWSVDAGLPVHFAAPPVPADNPMSRAKVELGRHLFYDKRLSGNGTLACAGCHFQHLAFTDGRALPVGSTGDTVPRSAQGLANVAYQSTLTWANPLLMTLERQMETPLFGAHPVEMGLTTANQGKVLARFARDESRVGYPALFAAAFPEVPAAKRFSMSHVIQAISAFERTLISGDSRFDRAQRGLASLSPAEERGLKLFQGDAAKCSQCHGGFNFSDQSPEDGHRDPHPPFHNTGLYNVDGHGSYPVLNRGVYETSLVASDMGKFRAPSLRNVAMTAPYMHDGSKPSLQAVLAHYARGGTVTASGPDAGDGRTNPYKDERVSSIRLTEQDQADLIAFLNTLTDDAFLTNPRLADPFKKGKSGLPQAGGAVSGR